MMKLRSFLVFILTLAIVCFGPNQAAAFYSATNKEISKNIEFILGEETVINPAYIQYLDLSEEKKDNVNLIPEPYLFIFSPPKTIDNATYPTKYNLRDYNYVTAVKNQGQAGLCWSYSMTTIIESTAKKKAINLSLSPKHFDYLTVIPTNYISEGINPYYNGKNESTDPYHYPYLYNRTFTGGGNNAYYQDFLAAGLTPGSTTLFGSYDPLYSNKLSLEKMFDQAYNEYVVTEAVSYPSTYKEADKQEWIEMIKNHIMTYGPLYVSTISPDYRSGDCYNSAFNMIDYKSTRCTPSGGHAMTIIGWDDNWGPNNEGAWILQNSWGNSNQFPYLSFNSENSGLYGIKTVEKKSFDNSYDYLSISNYKLITQINGSYIGNIQTHEFQKSSDIEELKYLTFSFNSTAQNQIFEVYISTTGKEEDLKLIGTVNTPYNGITKFSVENLVLENDSFLVGMRRMNGSYVTWYTVNAFTSNIENDTMTFNTYIKNSSYYRDFTDPFPSSLTTFINFKNKETLATAEYKIYNSKNEEVTNKFTLNTDYNSFRNYIINGKSVLRLSYITKNLPADWYTLKIKSETQTTDSMFDVSFLTSTTTYNRENGYMYLTEKTSNATFLNGIKTSAGTKSKIYDNTNNEITPSIMGTGMFLNLINNGETINYELVVRGDVDGDGYVDAYDILLMKRYGVGLNNLEGAYFEAGDIDNDKLLDAYDVLLVRRYIVGLGEL